MGKESINSKKLLKKINLILRNIEFYGFERYDVSQIKSLPFFQRRKFINTISRKFISVLDIYFPISIRKLFKMQKIYLPTTFTHIGNSFLLIEKYNIDIYKFTTCKEIVELGLKEYLSIENQNFWWNYSPNEYFFPLQSENNKKSTMHMHGLARFNILLLELAREKDIEDYYKIAIGSLKTAIKHHKIIDYNEKTSSISYWYNTKDCTININTEFLHWIALIPNNMVVQEIEELAIKIANLVLNEQKNDGSWNYFSEKFAVDNKLENTPDSHHTGTILYNLLNVIKNDFFSEEIKSRLIDACNKGMDFYLDSFFNKETGQGIINIGKKRVAGPVQYSEAIGAFCEFLDSSYMEIKIKDKIANILPKVVFQNINLISNKDGSTPSQKIMGKWQYLNSIRWGNGAVLQSLVSFLIYEKRNSGGKD